jgi:DNA helicase HerA-like ATPase
VSKLNKEKDKMCFFGSINQKGVEKTFGILDQDRPRHLYILGKTGMGKSNLLQNMCLQDIYHNKGVCFIDPHGDSVDYILDKIPLARKKDVIYFNPADIDFPIGLNVMEAESGEQPFLIASGIMSVFKRLWSGMWSTRMEYILNNTLLALLEQPGSTLLGVVKMLSDEGYAKKIVAQTKNPLVKNFWTREYANFHEKYKQEAIAPILNKIGQFFTTELMRNILGQKKSSISFRDIIDNNKILLVNLSKGKLGEDNSNILGSLIVTKLQLAAMSRVDVLIEDRTPFNLFVDEFQNFTTDSFSSILSEARKYGLNLTLAHQYINQLNETGNESVKGAIFGNIGSIVCFQLGIEDAIRIALEFEPKLTRNDLINLDKTQIAVKISVQGRSSQPFLAKTLPPLFEKFGGKKEIFITESRKNYSRDRKEINNIINQYLNGGEGEEKKIEIKPKKRLRKKVKEEILS